MEELTSILSAEHVVILGRLDDLERALEAKSEPVVWDVLAFFGKEVAQHRRKEEEVLFPEMANHFPPGVGPVSVMLAEHREERAILDDLRASLEAGTWTRTEQDGRRLLDLLREHIWKEDNVLYPMAQQILEPDAVDRVAAGFRRIGTFTTAASAP